MLLNNRHSLIHTISAPTRLSVINRHRRKVGLTLGPPGQFTHTCRGLSSSRTLSRCGSNSGQLAEVFQKVFYVVIRGAHIWSIRQWHVSLLHHFWNQVEFEYPYGCVHLYNAVAVWSALASCQTTWLWWQSTVQKRVTLTLLAITFPSQRCLS